jgi:tetratricopeptide (TPR) repeat protein
MILPPAISNSRWIRSRWIRHGIKALAGVLVVVLLVVGAWAWYRFQESRGLAALVEATTLAQQAEGAQATAEARAKAIAALDVVIARYPRLSAIPQASYQIGNLKYADSQYAQARAAYEIAVAKSSPGTIRTLAAMGVGYTWEVEKKYANAALAYEAAIKGLGAKDFLYEEVLMADARAQELNGKPDIALEIYQRLLRDLPDNRHAEDLRARVAGLRSRATR